jgi:S-adenosylmethionine synthetase
LSDKKGNASLVEAVAREAIKEIGYNDPGQRFNAAGVSVLNLFSRQAADIACGVDNGNDLGADGQLFRPERS